MSVPIQISWDLYLGQTIVWCEALRAGARRAVLLPRLDTIFSPIEEDPTRELPRDELAWRLVSPTEHDWDRYREMVEKQASRAGVECRVQRVENMARWMGGSLVSVPQYHIWLYREDEVGARIEQLYEELDAQKRRGHWRWLLAWTSPAVRF